MTERTMSQARVQLSTLVRRAAVERERVTITDRGEPAAVLVSAHELADLEEALALAEYRARDAAGELRTVAQAEARERLGLGTCGTARKAHRRT